MLSPAQLSALEQFFYQASQLFLPVVLILITVLVANALHSGGRFAVQAWQRFRRHPAGFSLHAAQTRTPSLHVRELEVLAAKELELPRLTSRIMPMLGLAATMIPMGPALLALADGKINEVAHHLTVAFSSVILALLAAALTHTIHQIKRRWLLQDLAELSARLPLAQGGAA